MARRQLGPALLAAVIIGGLFIGAIHAITDTGPDW